MQKFIPPFLFILFSVIPFVGNAFSDATDQYTSSRPSAVSNHTISFVAGADIVDSQQVVIALGEDSSLFDLSNIIVTDIDVEVNSVAQTIGSSCSGSEDASAGIDDSADTITLTMCIGSGGWSTGDTIEIEVGTHTSSGAN